MSKTHIISLGLSLGTHPLVGIAALPILQILAEQDAINLTKILGTGQGALAAAMIANKKEPEEIKKTSAQFYQERFYDKYNKQIAASMFQVGPQSYHPSQSLFCCKNKFKYFEDLFGEALIEDQEIPLTLIATDLYTAEPVYLTSGLLYKAVYGASAWFPFHPPLKYQGRLIVSGGFSEAIPTIEDDSLDVEISISIKETDTWEGTSAPSDGWAFFDRAFHTMDEPNKSKIRKNLGHNVIPLIIPFDKTGAANELSERDLLNLYNESEKVLRSVLSSKDTTGAA